MKTNLFSIFMVATFVVLSPLVQAQSNTDPPKTDPVKTEAPKTEQPAETPSTEGEAPTTSTPGEASGQSTPTTPETPTSTTTNPPEEKPTETPKTEPIPAGEGAVTQPEEKLEKPAEEKAPESGSSEGWELEPSVAVKIGGTFHSIFTELDSAASVELEGGLLLLGRMLEVDFCIGWSQPPASSSGTDPRLTNQGYDWKVYQDFLSFGLTARYRYFFKPTDFAIYGATGPRLYLLRTMINGATSSATFGENRQFETRFGWTVAVGGEYSIWLGAVLLELSMGFGELDGMITGDASSSSMDLLVGYRFMF